MGNPSKVSQIIKYCIFGTVIVVPFVYTPIKSKLDFFYLPKYISLVIIISFLLMILLSNLKRFNKWFHLDLINKILLVYFCLITVSLLFSINPILSIKGRMFRYDGYSTQLIYILLFLFARTIKTIDKRFIYAVTISASILSIYGIIQYYGFDPFPRDFIRQGWVIAFSTFGNQNFFGSFLVLQIPFTLYAISVYKNKWGYLAYALSLLALLMTSTRSAWIGYFLSSVLMYIILLRKEKQSLFIVLFSVIIVVIFNLLGDNQIFNRFMTMVNDTKILSTTSYKDNPAAIEQVGSVRMFIWIRVIKLISMRPLFGFGIENLGLAFEKYFYNDIIKITGSYAIVDKAHNDFLHIAVSSGVLSLLAYISFLISILVNSIKTRNSKEDILLTTSIFGYVICLFFNISVVSVAYIFWIYLGLLCRYQTDNITDN